MSFKTKKRFINISMFVLFAGIFLSGSQVKAQEYKDYLLKKVGNLYILNIGANDKVQGHRIYNLFFEETRKIPILRIPLKTSRKHFGAVQVTQLFPEYCVVRIVARNMEEEPTGNKIVMVTRQLPAELLERAYLASGMTMSNDLREELKDQIEKAPEGETITKTIEMPFKGPNYKPISIGLLLHRGMNDIAEPIRDNFIATADDIFYNNTGEFVAENASGGGFGVSASRLLSSRFRLQATFTMLSQENKVMSSGQGTTPEGTLEVTDWDVTVKSKVMDKSLAIEYSFFEKARAFFTGDERGRRFAPRIGLAVNHTSISVDYNEQGFVTNNLQTHEFNFQYALEENRSEKSSDSAGGYWGSRATLGLDVYMQALKVYGEAGYQYWFNEKFGSGIPIRFGIEVMF